jgi:hypothetical protein
MELLRTIFQLLISYRQFRGTVLQFLLRVIQINVSNFSKPLIKR